MTVGAPDITLGDLATDRLPPATSCYQRTDCAHLIAAVVELKHDGIIFTAVNTGIGSEVIPDPAGVCFDSRLLAPCRISHVVGAPMLIPLARCGPIAGATVRS
jgi:hypothetical protein